MKKKRLAIYLLLFSYIVILSPVSFNLTYNKVDEFYSKDKHYKAVIYNPFPFSPQCLYHIFSIDGPAVYIVLYDRDGKYIGQSSPFYFINRYDLNPILFVFPDDESEGEKDNFNLLIDGYGNAFKINIYQKTWWSKWFSLFY
ncbi:DUF6201 family protein [Pectobacterium parmentieri]|uniref:DUF6201 family protein n=1 Tax=Pectobacterium parmentieri TaxID=1905730 RepID=UPI0004735551|nr:DUF6201 family protein [Pectobacterium parmentieri]PWD60313.1 hypothetical protein DF211_16800 [Pectobacterium parmentieri]